MASKRILYLDIVKAIAITLVIMGHYRWLSTESYHIKQEIIYSFHMPLFMLISGFFSLSSLNKPFLVMLTQKTQQLIIPALVASVIIVLLQGFYCGFSTKMVLEEMGCGLWFLRCLFMCLVTTYIVRLLPINENVLLPVSAFILFVVPYATFLQYNYLYVFFLFGFFIRKFYHIYNRYISVISIISLVSLILLILFNNRVEYCNYININTLCNKPLDILAQIIRPLSISLFLIGLTKHLVGDNSNITFLKKFGNIGSCTLGIYVLQSIILERLMIWIIKTDGLEESFIVDWIVFPLASILLTVIFYKMVKYLSRFRLINLLLFGGQYKGTFYS